MYNRQMTKAGIQQEAMQLQPEERQELAEMLWQSLEGEPVPLPEWQRRLLDERIAALDERPEEGSSWQEVEARVWTEGDGA
jgi:putative addiction module component (TIGR02574 family)